MESTVSQCTVLLFLYVCYGMEFTVSQCTEFCYFCLYAMAWNQMFLMVWSFDYCCLYAMALNQLFLWIQLVLFIFVCCAMESTVSHGSKF